MASVGAAALFTDVLTHVFTGAFTDVFTDVFPDVVTGAFTGAFTDVFTGVSIDVFTGVGPELLESSRIIDLGAFCVELRPIYCIKRIWPQCRIFRFANIGANSY